MDTFLLAHLSHIILIMYLFASVADCGLVSYSSFYLQSLMVVSLKEYAKWTAKMECGFLPQGWQKDPSPCLFPCAALG